jgi:hypothetical protein
MKQLLEIKRIPIDIEIKITRAKLERNEEVREKQQQQSAVKLPRAVSNPSTKTVEAQNVIIDDPALRGDTFELIQGNDYATLTYQAIAAFKQNAGDTENGEDEMIDPKKIKAQAASRPIESVLSRLPQNNGKNAISWSNGKLNMNYELDSEGEVLEHNPFENDWIFVPGKIEIDIKQMPKLEIEYTGGPIYFPRSADPNYIPPEK